jgi:ribosomal protein S18 acetylase RimI-like enzyme
MYCRGRNLVQKTLTETDLDEVKALASNCNKFEGLDYLTPNVGMKTVLCYETGQLVGLLAVQQGIGEEELSVIVKPEKRRLGIGRALLEVAKVECRKNGVRRCLLVCQESSQSGKAFVKSTGSHYEFSEYRMTLDQALFEKRKPSEFSIELQQAGLTDAKLLAGLSAKSFGDAEEKHLKRYTKGLQDPTRVYYIVRLNGEPIGSIGTVSHDEGVDIVAFGIVPARRGKGYGVQTLYRTIITLLEKGHQRVRIEVETENRNALALYRQCGFIEQSEYGYYAVNI